MASGTNANRRQGSDPSGTSRPVNLRGLKILFVVIIIVLTVQGWFGDFVNVFLSPASGTTAPPYSASGFFQAVQSLGFGLVWHTFEGILLVALSTIAAVLSFRWSSLRSVRISAALGTLMIFSAAFGGLLFVLSGFSAGGSSMQMGGSFIGAYAFYFLALFFSK